MTHDSGFIYAACRDLKVKVWSKPDLKMATELGEMPTIPLAVHVDSSDVYAACEKRVYVWKKHTWGMTGWFELTYQAASSTLRGDDLYVGARDGRLICIKKDSHDTSSWQLHKSEITSLWADEGVVVTSAKKEPPVMWRHKPGQAPAEVGRLPKKQCSSLSGNQQYILFGLATGEVELWDRVEGTFVKSISTGDAQAVVAVCATNHHMAAATAQNVLTVWDLETGSQMARIALDTQSIDAIDIDHDAVYVAGTGGVHVVKLSSDGTPFDLQGTGGMHFVGSVLRTSPYDVLESVVELRKQGDACFEAGSYPDAVQAYEGALQILIDNTHALLEVPEEREGLTRELNSRLGSALLRTKAQELKGLVSQIEQLSDELDQLGKTKMDEEELQSLWDVAVRAMKESRVLAEAQAGDMLSYQIAHLADTLEGDLASARAKLDRYQAKLEQAKALVRSVTSEWRRMERRRTALSERQTFLDGAISHLEAALTESKSDPEVAEILAGAITEYRRLHEQISKIVDASKPDETQDIASREEAIAAVNDFLQVVPRKRDAALAMADDKERARELGNLANALRQALETARKFKMKDEVRNIENEIQALEGLKS